MNKIITTIFLFLFMTNLYTQSPDTTNYKYKTFQTISYKTNLPEGYWMFVPEFKKTITNKAKIVVFMHGYGAYNPKIYGAWFRHLIRQGHIVIFPRYQKNLVSPKAKKFPSYAAQGIRSAIEKIKEFKHISADFSKMAYAGHSYGGVIIANLAVNYKNFEIPKPNIALLCAPGTGVLKGALLESYQNLPEDINLMTISAEKDYVVGKSFSDLITYTAINTKNRWWLNLVPDSFEMNDKIYGITAYHNESYAIDGAFDSGKKGIVVKRAERIGRTNILDYHVFWRILDDFMYGAFSKFELTELKDRWTKIGIWPNGKEIQGVEVVFSPLSSNKKSLLTDLEND